MNQSPIKTLDEVERLAILNTLARLRGNRTHTAKALKISVRALRDKLVRYKALGFQVVDPEIRRGPRA